MRTVRRGFDLEEIVGSRTLMQRAMSEEKIDRLSLQSAAVTGILTFDVPAAKDLYRRMPPLTMERLSCDDALVPDPSAYYELLENGSRKRMLDALAASGPAALRLYARLKLMSEVQANSHETSKDNGQPKEG